MSVKATAETNRMNSIGDPFVARELRANRIGKRVYLSNSAATTLMLPMIATISLSRCPSVILLMML